MNMHYVWIGLAVAVGLVILALLLNALVHNLRGLGARLRGVRGLLAGIGWSWLPFILVMVAVVVLLVMSIVRQQPSLDAHGLSLWATNGWLYIVGMIIILYVCIYLIPDTQKPLMRGIRRGIVAIFAIGLLCAGWFLFENHMKEAREEAAHARIVAAGEAASVPTPVQAPLSTQQRSAEDERLAHTFQTLPVPPASDGPYAWSAEVSSAGYRFRLLETDRVVWQCYDLKVEVLAWVDGSNPDCDHFARGFRFRSLSDALIIHFLLVAE